jgi:hypothetical protein
MTGFGEPLTPVTSDYSCWSVAMRIPWGPKLGYA